MASRPHGQESEEGTYMEIPMLKWYICNRLCSTNPEGETSRVWNIILNNFYAAEEAYSTGPEMKFGRGHADLFTSHLIQDQEIKEIKFLVVECKAPGLETQPRVWAKAADQLNRYLAHVAGRKRRVFGAVAIGRLIRFYQWDRREGGIKNIIKNEIELYIDRQCQKVTSRLKYIRDSHL